MHRNLSFCLMALTFRMRDIISPPQNILGEADIQSGMHVLDFGCGPGSFSLAAARLVGKGGMVYALDIDPLALKRVTRSATRNGLTNIRTVSANAISRLPDRCLDMALLYDVIHDIPDIAQTLKELHHLLKPRGLLSVRDHHLHENIIMDRVLTDGYFRFKNKGRWTYQFERVSQKQLCFESRKILRLHCTPRSPIFYHSIKDDQKFTHASSYGYFIRFSSFAEALIEFFDDRIAAYGSYSTHIQD